MSESNRACRESHSREDVCLQQNIWVVVSKDEREAEEKMKERYGRCRNGEGGRGGGCGGGGGDGVENGKPW